MLSKCAMMAVYSGEETRDNIQLFIDRMREVMARVNTAEIDSETEWRGRFM